MARIIALATSDIHFHDWKQFNETGERTQITINFLADLFGRSHEEDIPILHSGDLFHTPGGLTTKTLVEFSKFMRKVKIQFSNMVMIGITGNHDGSYDNSLWEFVWNTYPEHFINADYEFYTLKNKARVYGLPYRKRNIDLVQEIQNVSSHSNTKKILLLHTELYGAPDPSGYIPEPVNLPRDLGGLFKDFNLVLAGHVHAPTKIRSNIYMVGAPNQQRKSDAGCEFGYLEIYDDFSVKFMRYPSPGFRFYKEGEEHEYTWDFWVPIPQPKKMKKGSDATFKPTMDKTKMAKKYVKEVGIKSKRKLNTLIDVLNETED